MTEAVRVDLDGGGFADRFERAGFDQVPAGLRADAFSLLVQLAVVADEKGLRIGLLAGGAGGRAEAYPPAFGQ